MKRLCLREALVKQLYGNLMIFSLQLESVLERIGYRVSFRVD